jgi:hypothetical protein
LPCDSTGTRLARRFREPGRSDRRWDVEHGDEVNTAPQGSQRGEAVVGQQRREDPPRERASASGG